LTPEELVQQQLDGYNALNIEAFIAPYSYNMELYTFPNTLLVKGKDRIKEDYKGFFYLLQIYIVKSLIVLLAGIS